MVEIPTNLLIAALTFESAILNAAVGIAATEEVSGTVVMVLVPRL